MKLFIAVVGMVLLSFPLVRHVGFEQRMANVSSAGEVVSALYGVYGGLMMGFFGLMILGFLVDGGAGYRKPVLLISMTLVGVGWLMIYPSGWMLGLPLILYPAGKKFGFR